MCFAPVILIGLLSTIIMPTHGGNITPASHFTSGVFEAQTCQQGLGVNARATGTGIYSVGAQYGFYTERGAWSASLTPSVGGSYVSRDYYELPSRTNFSLSLQALIGYERYRVGVEYWHLSNGGTRGQNIGLDLMSALAGVTF